MVEQEVEPQPPAEQVEPAGVGDLPARVRVAHELRAVGDGDLARLDDAVAVRVLERVGTLEPRVDWIAHPLLYGSADDRRNRLAGRRIDAHVGDEVGVVAGVHAHVPPEHVAVHHPGGYQRLEPAVHDRTEVLEPRNAPADGRRDRAGDQGILGPLVVVGEVDAQPMVEQDGLAADFELERALGL